MDVGDLVSSNGVDFKYASGGRELLVECPFCQREKLYINADTGLWNCARCGERGNMWTLATKVLGLDNYDAFRLTREIEKGLKDAPRFVQQAVREAPEEISLPASFSRLTNVGSTLDAPYWMYLFNRGLSEETIKAYDIGRDDVLSGPGSRYKKRVIIPVRQDGVLRSFVARSIHDACPACHKEPCRCQARWQKALHPEDVRMAQLLFNIDRMRQNQEIVLMEGVFDALRLPAQAVCSFGAHLSREQRALLRKRTDKVIICWDGDEVGRAGAHRVAQELVSDLITVRIARLPDGTDPGNLPLDVLRARIAVAEPFDLMSTVRVDKQPS